MQWLEVSVHVVYEAAEAVAEVFRRYAPQGVAIDLGEGTGVSQDTVIVKAYLIVDDDILAKRRSVEQAVGHLRHIWPVIPEPVFKPIEDQDWTAGWKESIPVLHLGGQVVIKPSWKNYQPQAGEIILEMDPGMAFGTGLHPTTQLCVEVLEHVIQPGMSVLDLGSGTGILSLIAAKMAASEVVAVDLDSNAVAVTRRNARVNAVSHQIHPVHGSLKDVHGAYDLVLANILANVIVHMAEKGLADRVRSGGVLVASGILVEQADEVHAALEKVGLRITEQRQKGDWVALCAKKP